MSSNISDQNINGIKRRRTGSGSEIQINPSFEIDTKDIKVKLEKETKECFKVMEENNDLSNKIKELADQIKSKDLQINDMNVENEGLINECKKKTDKLKTCTQFNRKMIENLNQLREKKNRDLKSVIIARNKIIKEKDKRILNMETTEKKLKTYIEQQSVMIDEKERTFESLSEEKNNLKTECKTLKKQIKYLESELAKIRQMRQFFNNQNEFNKKKRFSNAVYGIDMHSLYENELRQSGKNMIDVNIKLLEKIDNFVKQAMKESRSEGIQQLADTIENINEKMDVIIAKKDKIEEKRTDGKINCGDCQKTFETTSHLKHHYTVTHKKNTTNPSKNQIEIIELTLDE